MKKLYDVSAIISSVESLELVSSMKKISFFFFVILGATHFLFANFGTSGIFQPTSLIISRILFIPFLLVSLSYAYALVKEHLLMNGKNGKTLDYVFLGIGIVTLIGSLFIEFYFPDKTSI